MCNSRPPLGIFNKLLALLRSWTDGKTEAKRKVCSRLRICRVVSVLICLEFLRGITVHIKLSRV